MRQGTSRKGCWKETHRGEVTIECECTFGHIQRVSGHLQMSPPQDVMLHDSKSAVPPQTMAPAPISDLILHAKRVTLRSKLAEKATLRANQGPQETGGAAGLRAVCNSRFALGDVDASYPQVMVVAPATIVHTSARLRQEILLAPRQVCCFACAREDACRRRRIDCRSR
jgi:hypothetical protein